MISVELYTPGLAQQWNAFVAEARNGIFLFDRRYMDYHADRFHDFSLVARDARGHILALLPACRVGDSLRSHSGLTFGGWIMPRRRCDTLDMLEIHDAAAAFLRDNGIRSLLYRPSPHIYHSLPAEEDIYALVRAGASLSSALVAEVLGLADPLPFDQGARQRVRKLAGSGIVIARDDDFPAFWDILTDLLRERYGATPVHSLDEITLLHSRFPDNIRLYTAREDGRMIAGVVMYVNPTAAHSQYTAATPRGKETAAVAGIYAHIIRDLQGTSRYLDFGTSNEDGGREVNPGLVRQKCSYGGRAIVYPTFTLDL